ncbi:MAG: hypothetical protein MZW92_10565 [Comamonadaceae bacterium]|nr:hypothetical protein [Comamonadaceae bacterium]
MPTLRQAGGQRPDLHAMAYRAPCARRPAPRILTGRNHHLNGMASITEGANGFPGSSGRIPGAVRHDRADPAGQRLEHLLAGQEPQRPESGSRLRREPQAMAAPEGLRPLLRLHRRRDQPVVSRPRGGQPLSSNSPTARKRATTSPRTWPTRPSR